MYKNLKIKENKNYDESIQLNNKDEEILDRAWSSIDKNKNDYYDEKFGTTKGKE